jgi:hypothetical protein
MRVYMRADAGSRPTPNRVERGFLTVLLSRVRDAQSSSNRLSVVLRKLGAWRDDLRKTERCVRESRI